MKRLFQKHPVGCVCALAFLCLLPVILLRDFSPANELRYLSIADEAIAQRHFLSFSNHGEPYADKPPLYFWIVMLCRTLTGGHRMPLLALFSLLPALAAACVVDRWAFRRKSALTRAAAAMMLLTSAFWMAMAVYVRMDLLMCLFILLALYQAWKGRCGAFGLFTFLALFTKGPVGLLLPILSLGVYRLAEGQPKQLLKDFNWPFWAILGGLSALWIGGVYWEAGPEYLHNLLFHQTFDRAVHAFHHQAPWWFYGAVIWGVAAPWCLLTLPGVVASCLKADPDNPRTHRERYFGCIVLTGFVMLSLFSSKLPIYLLPLLPPLAALFVLVAERRGYEGWMRVALGLIAALLALLGVGALAALPLWERLPIPEEFAFARSAALPLSGALLLLGSIRAFTTLRQGWQRPVLALGCAMLLVIPVCASLLPEINALTGYRQLCADIQAQDAEAEVWMAGLYRPENVDVYLGRSVHVLELDSLSAALPQIPPEAAVVTPLKADAAASGRYSDILQKSGRSCTRSSGRYGIWTTPAPACPPPSERP